MTVSESIYAPSNTPFQMTAMEWIHAYWMSRCVYVVAKLGIADLLKDGAQHCDTLAKATDTHSDALYRILRALASVGIFAEIKPRYFALTPLADNLQTNHPESVRAMAILRGEEHYYKAWGDLMYSLQTGDSAFERLYGMDLFEYNDRDSTQGEIFDRAMAESEEENTLVLEAYDFSSINKLADIGGGKGLSLATILQAYPSITGILFDRPDVVERAKNSWDLALRNRCEFIGGSFFEEIPTAADAYILKHIIQDWDNERSLTILQRCHQAMKPQSRLLVIDFVIPPGNEFYGSKFIDVNMLVMCPGGRIRTEEEFHKLFQAAGFKITQIIPTQSEVSIIEAIKIS
ncbi:acetylserotonin O-methyltransferase [Nostoc sp. CMAA1605]|uniref:acetylserotonin O-methyltransferase n=1 Tax=Nostoc sp. CMAA1605 TaxID=2055159 RepID=UPI001F18210D|nr:acetylserotonin O-methyltransferase [Nostoc sp. CMAA1605]